MYFRHGHVSHHIHVGEQSQNRAWRLDLAQDADMLSHLSYIYAMRRISPSSSSSSSKSTKRDDDVVVDDAQSNSSNKTVVKASHRLASICNPLLRYLCIAVLAPLLDTLAVLLFAIPVGFVHLFVRRSSSLARRKLTGYLLHCALLYTFLTLMTYYVSWRCLLYLFLSRLFFCGWLGHPLLAFWCTVHRSHHQQSTTTTTTV